MLLPGPEAQQLATYIGWLMHRTRGGLIAGGLFILPGIVAIMALSCIYAAFGKVGVVAALFFGLKAAVLAIVHRGGGPRSASARCKNNVMVGARGGGVRRRSSSSPCRFRSSSSRRGLIGFFGGTGRAHGVRDGGGHGGRQGGGRGRQPARRRTCRRMRGRTGARALTHAAVLAGALARPGRRARAGARPRQRLQPDRGLLLRRWRW